MAPRLLIEGLRKSYGSREVLKGVSLSIEPGQIVALLGPNGAGKTTLISIVAGLRRASGGRVEVEGIDVLRNAAATRDLMGLASQDTAVYPTVTVRDNLRFFAEVAGVAKNVIDERVVSVAASFGLGDLLDTKARFLSGGERRRLHTAIALVHEPPLLLLDEPTVGADVRTRSELVAHVASLATRGAAVLYCTHYLSEVEELGPDVVVAILDHGTIVASGPVRSLYADVGRSAAHVAFCAAVSDDQIDIMQKTAPPGADVRRLDQSTVVVSAARPSEAAIAVVNQAAASIPELRSVTMVGTTLDDVFLSITGRPYEIGDSE